MKKSTSEENMYQTLLYDIQRSVNKFSENDRLGLYNYSLAHIFSDIILAMEKGDIPVESVIQDLTDLRHAYCPK